ncbi:MAG: hypothetical protein J5939_08260, partial [Bacteroidales bacterium]|nr:hypothetical protein [Bacteroidales bacterium]
RLCAAGNVIPLQDIGKTRWRTQGTLSGCPGVTTLQRKREMSPDRSGRGKHTEHTPLPVCRQTISASWNWTGYSKNKTPKIPPEIRRDYIRGQDALKKYHIGQKRFSEMTKAAGVTKIRTKGNYVWYKKSELDTLFFMINARI